MAISIIKYVDIVSGIGGGAVVTARELIGRLFSTNILIPTSSLIEFSTLEEVGVYFGTSSEEYKRAQLYFGFVSKSIRKANKIAFARWTDVDVAARIFGSRATPTLAEWQAITDGSLTLTLGAEEINVPALDFNAAASLADVAAVIQAGIQAASANPLWSAATVTYNAVTGGFDLIAGATGDAEVAGSAGTTGTDIFSLMGWANAVYSDGDVAEEPIDALTASDAASDNFGSFLFQDTLTLGQVTALANFVNTQNVRYMYMVPVLQDDAQTYYDTLKDLAGVGLTLLDISLTDNYHEMNPMIILAATDYNARNSVQNYMFQMFPGQLPSVVDDSLSNTLDEIRVNYYGQTQQAGKLISFYQRGFLMGGSTAPVGMNVYANEQWLKDAATVSMLNLLLTNARVPANRDGEDLVDGKLQEDVVDPALRNGVISVGKELTSDQKAFITTVTGDENAWQQVQSIGYWKRVEIQQIAGSDPAEFEANYTLIYAKDDAIRKVNGTHSLI